MRVRGGIGIGIRMFGREGARNLVISLFVLLYRDLAGQTTHDEHDGNGHTEEHLLRHMVLDLVNLFHT
jgi:hypothetical protein